MIRTEHVYVVPRQNGEVVLGATVEERGFDTTVTAGAIHELLREAYRVLPEIAELELVDVSAGLRPGSPDNGPLVGEWEDGLLVATGHYRNGILLAPVTALFGAPAALSGVELFRSNPERNSCTTRLRLRLIPQLPLRIQPAIPSRALCSLCVLCAELLFTPQVLE